jgi:flagellum-specific peptidoglycan hydrolase FlgJ
VALHSEDKAEHLNVPNSDVEFRTTEFIKGVKTSVMAGFEKYKSAEDCFVDHAQLLANATRYAPAMKTVKSPEVFAQMLKVCGYSTALNYPAMLIALMKEFNLTQYDTPPPLPAAEQEAA